MNVQIPITIEGLADEIAFPGMVNFYIVDYEGKKIRFMDKQDAVTEQNINKDQSFPIKESIPCELMREGKDKSGTELMEINTNVPNGIQDMYGNTIFIVNKKSIIE